MAHTITETVERTVATVDVDDNGHVELIITTDGGDVRATFTVDQARELSHAVNQCAADAASYALEVDEENGEQS